LFDAWSNHGVRNDLYNNSTGEAILSISISHEMVDWIDHQRGRMPIRPSRTQMICWMLDIAKETLETREPTMRQPMRQPFRRGNG
jgi:hypothetical protein